MERLAPLTGRSPVPEEKRARFRFEAAKFEAAELTAQPSETVGPPRVQECPLQLEAEVASLRDLVDVGAVVVEAKVTRVHAAPGIVVEGPLARRPASPAAAPLRVPALRGRVGAPREDVSRGGVRLEKL